ncbi:MAG: cytochrome c maturation protein CcmE [Chloroflexota bacterium]|nr:cytochrome c maturation protein CcmE [Chloroflexota bacterium]
MVGGTTRRSYRFPILGAIAILAVGFLIWRSTSATSAYALTVSELLARGDVAQGQRVRVLAKVEQGSIQRSAETLRFTAVDATGQMKVAYGGVVPDIFKDNVDVVLEGSYGRDRVFAADVLLAKCPSKFESQADAELADPSP